MPRPAAVASSWGAPALTAALAAVYLVWAPPSAGLSAALYRAGQFSRAGFVLYDPQWYAGYHPLGYSLLLGPLGSLLGVRLLGAVSAVAAAAAFARLLHPPGRPAGGAGVASFWFAAGIGVSLGSGRIEFDLGGALGLAAALAVRSADPPLAPARLLRLARPAPVGRNAGPPAGPLRRPPGRGRPLPGAPAGPPPARPPPRLLAAPGPDPGRGGRGRGPVDPGRLLRPARA